MCEHEWGTSVLAPQFIFHECKKCHAVVTVTGTNVTYDWATKDADTSVWSKEFAVIEHDYAFEVK